MRIMTEYTDTHTHLYDETFAGEYDNAIGRATDAGVTRMVFPDIDSNSREAWTGKKICAIGEIGMDCYWSKEFVEEQKTVFRMQLELAHEMNLPVIIHSRESTSLILDILEQCRHLGLRGVFHAFSGSIETFRSLSRYGDWYVGIGGVLTYKKASIAETVKEIPLERILLETDSPYLTPVPKRGTRNESAYIPLIAEKLALQKGVDTEEIAAVTTTNARSLFGI